MDRETLPKIWRIKDASEYRDSDGKAVPYLAFVGKSEERYYHDTVIAKSTRSATLEELVGLCDQDAESVNAHDYCGAHRLIGALLIRRLGRASATEVMRDIAERRGLHGMNGLCGIPDSYASLDVGENGHDWDGTYSG